MQNTRKITSFDIKYLSEELNNKLKNTRVQKVFSFNPTEKKEEAEIHLLVHIPKKGTHRLIIGTDKIFITKKPIVHDEISGSFALYLRKHLKSKKIIRIKQHNFDRVLIIEFENNFLVCEIFGKGNIIFLDKENRIVALKTRKIWSQRALKRGEEYIYPPATENIFSIDYEMFVKLIKKSDKRIVAYLSGNLSLGKEYANIVCDAAKINKTEPCYALKNKELNLLFKEIKVLIDAGKKPFVLEDENKRRKDYYPVDVYIKGKKHFKKKFYDAIEQYYLQYYNTLKDEKKKEKRQKDVEKSKTILKNQMKNKEKIEDKIKKTDKTISIIKQNYSKLAIILLNISKALLNIKIRDVIKKIKNVKNSANENIKIIENIDEKTKEILFNIKGIRFKFFLNKTVEQNLAIYYDELKKLKGKLSRLEFVQKKQEEIVKERQEKHQKRLKKRPVEIKRQWYYRFHWFFTSGNILAVGGKTAQQNDELIKKYAKDKDIVFHCDIAGSSFVVLKTSQSKNEPTKEEIYETAVFSAVHSRAWRVGIGGIESYWVKREQVTKKAPSGEYIGTGSFMIYGKKNTIKTVLEYAVGFANEELIFGPVGVVQKKTNKFIVIVPGDIPKSKLAKQIKKELEGKVNKKEKETLKNINANDIETSLPGLSGNIKR